MNMMPDNRAMKVYRGMEVKFHMLHHVTRLRGVVIFILQLLYPGEMLPSTHYR